MKADEMENGIPVKPLWQTPRLQEVGDLGKTVRGGGGKLSATGGDPGDIRKPRGLG
jgi:hypothetical protein